MTDGKGGMSLPRTTGLGFGASLAMITAIVTLIAVVVDGVHDEAQPAKYQGAMFGAIASIVPCPETLLMIVPAIVSSTLLSGYRSFPHASEGEKKYPVNRVPSAASVNSTNKCVV